MLIWDKKLMKFFTKLGNVFDRINFIMVIISAVFLLGLTFIVGADITLRYLFLRPLGWVKEISEYILVVLGFLVAMDLKDDGHVKMDLVLTRSAQSTNLIKYHHLHDQHDCIFYYVV
jgi:TRAP-type C4-dicarboxylate transport system permease small subunit